MVRKLINGDFLIKNKRCKNIVCGGSYDEGVKIGQWVDLDDKFGKYSIIIH